MAANNHQVEVVQGIQAAANPLDNPGARCAAGGAAAAHTTLPSAIPIIREWEYAAGSVIAFSKVDSCLGAVQIVNNNLLRGAHFSMFASGVQYDSVQFNAAMANAGFQQNLPILYFGGGVAEWLQGLIGNNFQGVGPFPQAVADAAQVRWIFEMNNGAFTYHSM
jgi:hypothetical protein